MGKNTNKQKNTFALEVAQEAVNLYKKEQLKERKKTIFRNTKILLKHLNELKAHCENAKIDIQCLKQEDADLITGEVKEEIIIQSIKRTKAKTIIMVAHIEASIEMLKSNCALKDQLDKYKVIELMYIDDVVSYLPISEKLRKISEILGASESTIKRWQNEMITDLSILLYGVGGLNIF